VKDDQLLSWDASSRKLEWLDLGFTQVTDRLFLEVDQPTWDVKRLSLELTNISDASMSSIAAMDNLTELDLTECKVTDRGIAELAKHRSLRKLWVGGTQVSDASIEVLSSIPKLESLIYEGSAITPQGFVQLARKNPLLRRKPRP
jgi:Leucine-rich repeat (LRR) protein